MHWCIWMRSTAWRSPSSQSRGHHRSRCDKKSAIQRWKCTAIWHNAHEQQQRDHLERQISKDWQAARHAAAAECNGIFEISWNYVAITKHSITRMEPWWLHFVGAENSRDESCLKLYAVPNILKMFNVSHVCRNVERLIGLKAVRWTLSWDSNLHPLFSRQDASWCKFIRN